MMIPNGTKLLVVSASGEVLGTVEIGGMNLNKTLARTSLVEDVIAFVADDMMNNPDKGE